MWVTPLLSLYIWHLSSRPQLDASKTSQYLQTSHQPSPSILNSAFPWRISSFSLLFSTSLPPPPFLFNYVSVINWILPILREYWLKIKTCHKAVVKLKESLAPLFESPKIKWIIPLPLSPLLLAHSLRKSRVCKESRPPCHWRPRPLRGSPMPYVAFPVGKASTKQELSEEGTWL